MAVPTLQAEGALASGNGGSSITAVLPAHQADDILVLCVTYWGPNTTGDAAAIPTPTNWSLFQSQNVWPSSGEINGRFATFIRRASSGSTADPVCGLGAGWDSGTDCRHHARAYVIRGVTTVTSPTAFDWDIGGPWSNANRAMGSVSAQTQDMVLAINFGMSMDDTTLGTAPAGWTAGTEVSTSTGTGGRQRSFTKQFDNGQSGSPTSSAAATTHGGYFFQAIYFVPANVAIIAGDSASLTTEDHPGFFLQFIGQGQGASNNGLDSAAGSETSSVSVSLAPSDSAAGTDTSTPSASAGPTDSAAGGDTSSLSAAASPTDSGTGTDSSSPSWAVQASDSAGDTETPGVGADLPTSDSGTVDDEGGLDYNVVDSGTAADSSSLDAAFAPGEAGVGGEVASGASNLTAVDAAVLAEVAGVARTEQIGASDGGSIADVAQLQAQLGRSDAAAVAEGGGISLAPTSFDVHDAGVLTDHATRQILSTLPGLEHGPTGASGPHDASEVGPMPGVASGPPMTTVEEAK